MKGDIFRNATPNKVGYNGFDLSHSVRTSFNMGELIPTCLLDCVPGDRIIYSFQNFFRAISLASPAYVNLTVYQDTFFVPYRIMWSNWEKFIVGELEVLPPTGNSLSSLLKGDLGDYFGLPVDAVAAVGTITFSAFPTKAYYDIYDYWYRDQDLITEKSADLVNGHNTWINTKTFDPPLKKAWMRDYFTSCRPTPQKYDPVVLPLLANDESLVKAYQYPDHKYPISKSGATGLAVDGDWTSATNPAAGNMQAGGNPAYFDPNDGLYVEINDEAALVSEVRRAVMLQEFLELLNRVGTRYVEFVQGVFGTFIGDARISEPEWISRHTQKWNISEVLATAESTGIAVGDQFGRMISVGNSKTTSYKCKEWGLFMTLTSICPTTSYHQGLHRMWSRDTWLDYFIPHFENIGEEAVKNKEIFLGTGMDVTKAETTFGYNPRNSSYKYQNDIVTGEMRDTLLFWNLSRDFSSEPGLNETFITCDPDHRIFSVTTPSEHKIIAHVYNSVTMIRPMQKYGNPKFV